MKLPPRGLGFALGLIGAVAIPTAEAVPKSFSWLVWNRAAVLDTALPLRQFPRVFPWRDLAWSMSVRVEDDHVHEFRLIVLQRKRDHTVEAAVTRIIGDRFESQVETARDANPDATAAQVAASLKTDRTITTSAFCPALVPLAEELERLRIPVIPKVVSVMDGRLYRYQLEDIEGSRIEGFAYRRLGVKRQPEPIAGWAGSLDEVVGECTRPRVSKQEGAPSGPGAVPNDR